MRLVWIGGLYPPTGAAGAEWTAHEFLLGCRRAGHDAAYWCLTGRQPYEYEGVPVLTRAPRGHVDAVIGHLGHSEAMRRVRASRRYWMAHGAGQIPPVALDGIITNSKHVAETIEADAPIYLLRPLVPDWRYEGARLGTAVTLINLSEPKGGGLLRRLIRLLPDVSFLGVRGAYGEQGWRRGRYENLTVWNTQPDINVALAATRILLMPSQETWGRVAIEAAWRRIPTIGALSPGAEEADVVARWARSPEQYALQIAQWLGNKDVYGRYGDRAHQRAEALQLEATRDMHRLIKHLEATV